MLYRTLSKYEQAEQLLKQALVTSERVLEPGNPFIAQNLDMLARLYYEQGDNEQAETFWKRSLAIYEKTFGRSIPLPPDYSTTWQNSPLLRVAIHRRGTFARERSASVRTYSGLSILKRSSIASTWPAS